MQIPITTTPPDPEQPTKVDVSVDLLSDGRLVIAQSDGVELAIRLGRREALDLARGLLRFANPRAYASRMAAMSPAAGNA